MFIEEHVINGGNNSHHNYNFKHDYVVLFTGCLFACHWFLCLNQSLSILSWQSITRFILGCIWMGVYIFEGLIKEAYAVKLVCYSIHIYNVFTAFTITICVFICCLGLLLPKSQLKSV